VTPPAFLTLLGNAITADVALTVDADVTTQTISITCSSIAYPTSVASKTYTFSMTVLETSPTCNITQITTIIAPSNITYTLEVDKTKDIYFEFKESP
jgi:hypothetical protein